MKTYSIYEAKTHFSELVKRAVAGERVQIGSHGRPTVELRAFENAAKSRSLRGIWQDKVWYSPDYDQADQEIATLIAKGLDR